MVLHRAVGFNLFDFAPPNVDYRVLNVFPRVVIEKPLHRLGCLIQLISRCQFLMFTFVSGTEEEHIGM